MSSSTGEYSEAYLKTNKGVNILAPMWTLTVITTCIVLARIYIRARIVKKVGLDDWAVVVGMVRLSIHFTLPVFISCPLL